MNLTQRRVVLRGWEVSLTPIEYELLKVFLTHRGKILTRQMLLAQVWGTSAHACTHSLHVYVAQLRRKIEPDPEQPRLIFTIPGVGYRFTDAEESEAVFRAMEPETKRRWCSLLGLPAFC